MKIVISDPHLLAQLASANDIVEIADPSGRVIARTINNWPGKLPEGVKIPWTEEEMTELSKQRGGRPLADIIRDLEGRK